MKTIQSICDCSLIFKQIPPINKIKQLINKSSIGNTTHFMSKKVLFIFYSDEQLPICSGGNGVVGFFHAYLIKVL